ncbi:MAG TPA: DUF3237 domain-containing protein [Polyangiaceae bacterium]|nr:DUF3237 domain-containing protein [Polyangiaceae bacterium]
MILSHEGLSLWWATPDAPAPLDEVVPRDGAAITVGVRPANPTNAVQVRYRVDGGIVQLAPGREIQTDYARDAQYFYVKLPLLPAGKVVEYCPVLASAGRQVPSPAMARPFPARFTLADAAAPANPKAPRSGLASAAPGSAQGPLPGPRWPLPGLSFLTAITLTMDTPQFIGETPEGIRVNFYVKQGTAAGPVHGTVFPGSADHMVIRRDGIGVIHVRAVIVTSDGAKLEVHEIGNIDFGEDGYERALTNTLPSEAGYVVCPRIATAHPKYEWLNRVQCLGQGHTRLSDLLVAHDIFTVRGATA